ncbi:YtzC family protein [Bacillus norwichensis]|uniref:YtzC family protein n=1 Tax=Bacillus norwichensis TaxID=2762217 RepID=A0ABR8VMR6_9BACI|nr:YtzC family protein [Bacillus norwichensis]MBD8006040.1 YtzC family protein [Bacillus norwichensis]
MTTRQSIDNFINRCESVILFAEEQYEEGNRQEHYHDMDYSEAMNDLEMVLQQLHKMTASANAQQREQLHRVRLKIQQLQNKMILLNHDRPLYSTWH